MATTYDGTWTPPPNWKPLGPTTVSGAVGATFNPTGPSTFNMGNYNAGPMTEIGPGFNNPGGTSISLGVSKSPSLVGGFNPSPTTPKGGSSGISFGSLASFGMSAATSILGALSTKSATKSMGSALGNLSKSFGSMFSTPSAIANMGQTISRSGSGNNLVMPNSGRASSDVGNLGNTKPFVSGPANNVGMRIDGSPTASSAPSLASSSANFTNSLLNRAIGLVALAALKNDKYQRSYNWELLLPGIGILAPELMSRYVQDVSFGAYSIDEVTKLRYGAETRGHAGVFNIPKVTVKFNKPSPDLVQTYLELWRNMIVDTNGFFSPKSKYAMTGYLIMLDTTGVQTGSYKLINMFPTRFPEHRLSYGATDIANYTVEFNVDRIESL